jgi:hypothetical protein
MAFYRPAYGSSVAYVGTLFRSSTMPCGTRLTVLASSHPLPAAGKITIQCSVERTSRKPGSSFFYVVRKRACEFLHDYCPRLRIAMRSPGAEMTIAGEPS